MRIYIKLSRNKELIPFNYQQLMTGTLHKWLGYDNEMHGEQSFYCFSWLQDVKTTKGGINIDKDTYFFISAYDDDLIKRIVKGIMNDPIAFCGCKVIDIQLKSVPEFSNEERFLVASPILVKRKNKDIYTSNHAIFSDSDFNQLLLDNLKRKLEKVGLDSIGMELKVDKTYDRPLTKLVSYKGVNNKVNVCPVIIKGTSEQLAFAWSVGLGYSTGIGFGSLK